MNEPISIHYALHDKDAIAVRIGGKVLNLETDARGCRFVRVNGCQWVTQDKNKHSKWAKLARRGSTITWCLTGRKWGRIVDGKIDCTCPAIDSLIGNISHDNAIVYDLSDVEVVEKHDINDHDHDDNNHVVKIGNYSNKKNGEDIHLNIASQPEVKKEENGINGPSDNEVVYFISKDEDVKDIKKPGEEEVVFFPPPPVITSNDTNTNDATTPSRPITKSTFDNRRTVENRLEHVAIGWSELIIGKELGSGAYGRVCKADYRCTSVAVKVIHPHMCDDSRAEEMFLEEAALLVNIRHPNIVACLGACVEKPNYAIVMELLPTSLATHLKRNKGPLFPHDIRKIALGIARGLTFLHQRTPPVIHRDLKPANILLDVTLSPRIADFGVSREKLGVTATMTRIGTPTYCAPEILNSEYYSTAADIYSFSLVCFSMITGAGPWKEYNLSPLQVMMRVAVKGERPPLPTVLANTTSPVLLCIRSLIETGWRQSSSSRPSADKIVEALVNNTVLNNVNDNEDGSNIASNGGGSTGTNNNGDEHCDFNISITQASSSAKASEDSNNNTILPTALSSQQSTLASTIMVTQQPTFPDAPKIENNVTATEVLQSKSEEIDINESSESNNITISKKRKYGSISSNDIDDSCNGIDESPITRSLLKKMKLEHNSEQPSDSDKINSSNSDKIAASNYKKNKSNDSENNNNNNYSYKNTKKKYARKICHYDINCYRTNPDHIAQYAHPMKDAKNGYVRILREVLSRSSITPDHKILLRSYRENNNISEDTHIQCCIKCGWSKEEYETGERNYQDD